MRQMEHERGGIDRLVSQPRLYLDCLAAGRPRRPASSARRSPRSRSATASGGILVLREVLGQAPTGLLGGHQDVLHRVRAAGRRVLRPGRRRRRHAVGIGVGPQRSATRPAYTIMGGTTQILRNIIGERMLGLPVSPGAEPGRTAGAPTNDPDPAPSTGAHPHLHQRPVIAVGPGRQVEQRPGFSQLDAMPRALRYDDGLAGGQLDGPVASGQLEHHRDRPGDQVQQSVTVGVDLAPVGRVLGEQGGPDREAVDALGWPPADLVDQSGAPGPSTWSNPMTWDDRSISWPGWISWVVLMFDLRRCSRGPGRRCGPDPGTDQRPVANIPWPWTIRRTRRDTSVSCPQERPPSRSATTRAREQYGELIPRSSPSWPSSSRRLCGSGGGSR